MERESQSEFYIFGGQMIQLRFGNLSSNKDNIMKKFNPVEYNRQLWGDFKRTKNHPKSCTKDHKYCHIPYEWGEDRVYANSLACLANDSTLVLPPREEDPVIPSYDMMTEENLDDWYAQSINRSIASMLNPQKKFYLPPAYEEELRVRYPSKPGDMIFVDEPYFKSEKAPTRKKMPSYLIKEVEKKKNLLSEHPCQAKLLQPKAIIGTPVKQRQPQDIAKPLRRRHAVLLINDIHYGRFLKKMSKPQQTEATFEQPRQHLARREMIYSFNLESMSRKNCDQPVPNSIIEREYERIKQPPKDFIVANRNHLQKQEEIQEKARQALNQKAAQAMAKIDAIVKKQAVSLEPISGNQAKRASTVAKTLRANATSNSLGSLGMEEKVLKLLNSMQVVSQHIDVQMANLNIHLSQITVQTHSNTIQHKWILKAEQKIKEREYVLAIDCYKQALILQQDSFIPIYNIAVLLEKEKMLTYAKDWLTLAKLKKTDPEKVSFGLALVQVKQLNFAAALKEIDELITTLEKTVQRSDRRKVDMTYYYLRALCYKKLEHFDKARLDYQIIIKHSKPSNYHSLSYFLLSVVFGQSRRHLKMKFDCLSYMNWRETLYLLFYEKGKRVKEEGLGPVELADRLSKLSFFNRFSKNLLKSLLEKSAYELIKKDTIIFASESESLILVSGLVTIWSHQNSITTPETVSVLGQGGIIGGGQIDNDLSSRPNYWFLAKTDLEVIKISREEFSLFWQGQITFEWDYKYNFLKNVGLFKGLPEATLFKLCEHIELKEYKYGQILFNDCSYRYQVLSKEGLGFCLAKNMISDPRFMRNKKSSKAEELVGRRRQKSKLCKLIRKNLCRFNRMKFNRLKYSGLFILIEGKMEVEDDRGFRCKDILSPRDYFGENLLIHSEGFHNYGRILVDSPSAKLYHLSAEKMLWAFTSLDKATMTANACNRKEIETLRFLRNRFNECLQVKMAKLMAKKD